MKTVVSLLLLGLLGTASLFGMDFSIDKSHSTVGFKIKHMMISTVNGAFNDFEGAMSYDAKAKKFTAFAGMVNVASVDTENKKRDDHLRDPDFFDVVKYPSMVFKMTKHEGDKLYGDLTIRDVTKPVVFDVDMGGVIKDPWGNTRIGLTLETEIDRTDYGLTWSKMMETGGLVVSNELEIILDLQGIAKK